MRLTIDYNNERLRSPGASDRHEPAFNAMQPNPANVYTVLPTDSGITQEFFKAGAKDYHADMYPCRDEAVLTEVIISATNVAQFIRRVSH